MGSKESKESNKSKPQLLVFSRGRLRLRPNPKLMLNNSTLTTMAISNNILNHSTLPTTVTPLLTTKLHTLPTLLDILTLLDTLDILTLLESTLVLPTLATLLPLSTTTPSMEFTEANSSDGK